MISYVKNHFALGFGIGRGTETDCKDYWPVWHLKMLMGPWVGNWTFRTGRKRRY